MDTNIDPSVDTLLAPISGSFILFATVTFIVWLLIAFLACAAAPDDRPWHFFWCTFLFLGPLGVVLALVAPSRPH